MIDRTIRSGLIVLLIFSVALAGCSSFLPGGSETPADTVTPANVPTNQPTATPVPQLAPGLTGNGVSDADALGAAHAAVLENTSYTLVENSSVRYRNGTPYHRSNKTVKLAANGSRYYVIGNGTGVQFDGSTFYSSAWSNGTQALTAQGYDDNISYDGTFDLGGRTFPIQKTGVRPTNHQRLSTLFNSVETRVIARERRNGTTFYRVAAINVTSTLPFEQEWNHPRNIAFRASISPRGLVREYSVEYTATLHNDSVRIRDHVRYIALDNTTIERPPWYDDAITNVSTPAPTGNTKISNIYYNLKNTE